MLLTWWNIPHPPLSLTIPLLVWKGDARIRKGLREHSVEYAQNATASCEDRTVMCGAVEHINGRWLDYPGDI